MLNWLIRLSSKVKATNALIFTNWFFISVFVAIMWVQLNIPIQLRVENKRFIKLKYESRLIYTLLR
jgi:hypothetical protein